MVASNSDSVMLNGEIIVIIWAEGLVFNIKKMIKQKENMCVCVFPGDVFV